MAKYASVALVKDAMGKIAVTDDGLIDKWLRGVEVAIDKWCNRPDGFVALETAAARLYAASGEPYLYIDECIAITLVAVKDSITDTTYTSWTSADWIAFKGSHTRPDFQGLPYNGIMTNPAGGSYDSFTSGRYGGLSGFPGGSMSSRMLPTARVTARWGYAATVPADIATVAIALTERMYKQGQGGFADTLASAELGAMMYIKRNADIQSILGPYRMHALG